MPSRPVDTGWAFDAVIDLIESDLDAASPALSTASTLKFDGPAQEPGDGSHPQPVLGTPFNQRLGDFTKLFSELGISLHEFTEPASPVDSDGLISSDAATLNDQTEFSSPGEHGDPDSPLAGLTAKQHKQARKKAAKKERKARRALEASAVPADPLDTKPGIQPRTRSNVGAKIRPATPAPVEVQPDALTPHRILRYTHDDAKPVSVNTPKWNMNHASHPVQSLAATPLDDSLHGPATQPPAGMAPPFLPHIGQFSQSSSLKISHIEHDNQAAKQTLPRISPISTPSSTAFQPKISSFLHSNHGLVPRTVQLVNTPRVKTRTSVLQPSTTPLYEPNTPGQSARGKAYVPPGQAQENSTQTPYKILSPNRFLTPVQTSATPGGSFRGLTIRPQTDKNLHFLNQLLVNFPADAPGLLSPMSLTNQQMKAHGIHCFVDASNIMIGFRDMLRKHGHHNLEMSFDTLALLMERRRPVAKRICAGSHREAAPVPHVTKLVETSKAVGYENLVKEQVFIRRDDSERKKFFKDVERMGWTKATQLRSGLGSGSDSETGQTASATPSNPKWVEQGVDEILHLKMCQSIIDTEVPTTMVLATGDGNAAEFSDGFLANVERALKNGWTVELVSWKQQMSAGYRNKKFRAKWGEKFKVIELDDYLESLIDTAGGEM